MAFEGGLESTQSGRMMRHTPVVEQVMAARGGLAGSGRDAELRFGCGSADTPGISPVVTKPQVTHQFTTLPCFCCVA